LITSGSMSADRITSGVLEAKSGNSYYDLNGGELYSEGEIISSSDPDYGVDVRIINGDVNFGIDDNDFAYVGPRRLYGTNPNTLARFLDSTAIRIGAYDPYDSSTQAIELIQDGVEDFDSCNCGIRLEKNNTIWIRADRIFLEPFNAYDRDHGQIDALPSGSFRTADNKTVVVEKGFITRIY